MAQLAVTVGDLHFTGRWETGAPRTVDAIGAMLPLRERLIHVRWSGEGCWIPFGDQHLDLPWENATSHPVPGLSNARSVVVPPKAAARVSW